MSSSATPAPDGGERAPEPPAVAFSQEGMLWYEHFAPGCQNLPGLARRYRGALDVGALERALDEIVRRHEPLRTNFDVRDGRPVQLVRPHQRLSLSVRDLEAIPDDRREAHVEQLVAEAGREPFDLAGDALFQPTLLRLAEDDHVLAIRTHHTVFDDWSVGVFRRELVALYVAYHRGDPSPLTGLPLTFTEFTRRQRRRLAGAAGARQAAFWRQELAGAPFTTQLPIDDPGRAEGSPQPAGDPVRLELPAHLRERLQVLARDQRATVFMTLLAAWGVLVHRYTGQDDLLLATVVANRNRTDLEGMIGCFTKKVPLRLRLSGDPAFTEVLSHTRTALLGALSNQDLPFEAVVQDALGDAAASHGVVPQPVLMFQGVTAPQPVDLPGVESTGLQTSLRTGRAHFMAGDEQGPDEGADSPWGCGLYLGAFLILSVDESGDELTCTARGAFHAPAVRAVLTSFATLLSDAVTHPARRVSELALLDERGRAEARARGPEQPVPEATCPEAYARQVERTPQAVAVHSPRVALTFAELAARAGRLAHRLAALGVAAGGTVGIALAASPDAVVAALGAWKAGARWVALDPLDEPDRLEGIVEEASVDVIVGEVSGGAASGVPRVAAVIDGDASTGPVDVVVPPGATAVVFYGARRSAVSPPVVLDHRGVLSLRDRLRAVHGGPPGPGPSTRVCLSSPPTDDGFLRQLVALLDGHRLIVPDGDPWEALCADGIDVLHRTPEDLDTIDHAGIGQALADRPAAAGRPTVVVGTRTAVGPERWQALGDLATHVRTRVLFGPPRFGFAATAGAVKGADARETVGRPLSTRAAVVLDARGEPLPPRALGRLHLEEPGVGDGRLLPTGQLARSLPDGRIELLGPVEADTDLRGFRIDPARIRSVLARCPGVQDVAVGLPRDADGVPRLVATVVPDGRGPTLTQLRAFLWARLPGYAWPCELVVAGAASGDGGADPLPEADMLAGAWADVLGVERVEPTANYWQDFSFLEALDRARDAGLRVAGEQVTRNRTVETLAADVSTWMAQRSR